ncbi:hypothetical protein [Maricaulis sp.]|uniref:hypothetical protein n=1 Tax=unclassified Maricaulis TaxID=2632371 RepID=UPI001AFE9A5D|nr:hypothetical protein [Maricaulis sp.]MBO6795582.1 hypothetical protein [Maricaulis sp.]
MTKTDTLPAGSLRKLPTQRENARDDLVADYVGLLMDETSRALQLGESWIGAECERRKAILDTTVGGDTTPLDLLILGDKLGFSTMAEHWATASARLKIGGVLLVSAASQAPAARLCDTLFIDPNWAFEDMIGGEVAVFRRIRKPRTQPDTLKPVTTDTPAATEKPAGLMSGVMRTLFKDRSAPLDRTR